MAYSVKEIYVTLQGEGAQTGRVAVFLRFSGCNLWSGRERDRASAICRFCDTDFIGTDGPGGGRFRRAEDLARAVQRRWHSATGDSHDIGNGHEKGAPPGSARPLVVCTGGEPLLQLDAPLVAALHIEGFEIAIETNGTLVAPDGIDWVCVSPKADTTLTLRAGNELKLVFPQKEISPEAFDALDFEHFFLQPMDGPAISDNTAAAIAYCTQHPKWRLSLQSHKLIGIN